MQMTYSQKFANKDLNSVTTSAVRRHKMALDQSKRFYVFNCDKTYNVEIVEKFLLEVEEKYGFKILVDSLYFGLQRMDEVCETTIPKLVMDFAVFVLHANESRLSINEEDAGIGYARIYRALLQKTHNRVLIVIGGDTYYTDEDEEARFVISRWAKRKMASQFGEEHLDGRQSFIFSWNEKHRPIHEEAMRHFLDAGKRGLKFDFKPPEPLPKPIAPSEAQPSPKTGATVVPLPHSAATSDLRQKPFLVESDRVNLLQDDLNTSETRRHDQKSQETDLKPDLQKTIYGAFGSDQRRKLAVDQAETVLLETKVFFGVISYDDEDISQNKDGWRPSARQESAVREDLKSFPLREVKFYRTGDDPAVIYTYDPTPSAWKRCCSALAQVCRSCIRKIVACFVWLGRRLRSLCDWCRDNCRCC